MNTTTKESFEERITRLRTRTAVDGWKGLGSAAVRPATWEVALRIIKDVADSSAVLRAREPFVSAGDDGSISIRWSARLGGENVEVSIEADGSIECDLARESGILELATDVDSIASHVKALYAA